MNHRIRMLRAIALGLVLVCLAGCTQEIDIAEVRAEIGDDPVIMLSTSTCGYCEQMRADLEEWNVDYVDIDVEADWKGQQAFEMLEGRGVPILLVGEKTVHGYSPERAHALLTDAELIPN